MSYKINFQFTYVKKLHNRLVFKVKRFLRILGRKRFSTESLLKKWFLWILFPEKQREEELLQS